MELVNRQTGEIVTVHPEEAGAVAMLDQAISALTTALDQMPIGEVVNLKAKVATVATATKELGMSKEAQELAVEAVRRAEWALGRAIRKGQANGTVAQQGHALNTVQHEEDVKPIVPTDFATKGELYGARGEGILTIADAAPTPEEFDAALAEAKDEGNLSRANVARKAREKKGCDLPAPKPAKQKRRPITDAARDAGWELRKSVERLQRIAADDRFDTNKQQVTPQLRGHLENAIEVCQDLLDRINNN